eukprot:jgi/Bigna1/54482/estExt_Genewise1Plus.C_350062
MHEESLIRHPLEAVAECFKSVPAESYRSGDWGIPKLFESKLRLNEEDGLAKIPSLNQTSTDSIPNHSLVRFRGMIQDILDPEYYTGIYEEINKRTGTKVSFQNTCGDVQLISSIDARTMALSRIPVFCVPIPGESAWIHSVLVTGTPEKRMSTGMVNNKRARNVEPGLYDTTSYTTSSPFKVCDLVEFVAIFAANPALMAFKNEICGRFNPPASAVPRLHVISFRRIQRDWGLIPRPQMRQSYQHKLHQLQARLKDVRKSLLDHMTKVLGGDKIVAETLLVHLMSRVHYRMSGQVIGKMSLALLNVPPSFPKIVKDLFADLLPTVNKIEVTIQNMNKEALMPVKDYDLNHLSQGKLQNANGTHLIIDETNLNEGKLSDLGVKNLRAIQQVIEEQKVNYDFKYHQMAFATDSPVLVLSTKKSILKCDCTVKLNNSRSLPASYEAVKASPKAVAQWREYLLFAKMMEIQITPEAGKLIQEDLVKERKFNPKMEEATMHLKLGIARLLASSFLEGKLSKDRWEYAKPLIKHIH